MPAGFRFVSGTGIINGPVFALVFTGKHLRASTYIVRLFLAWSFSVAAQTNIEVEFGGANYIGFSANSGLDIPLSKDATHVLMPSLGWGVMLPPAFTGTGVLRFGLQYRYRGWGLGAEMGRFFSPFGKPFVELLLYPNISHTVVGKGSMYYRMSMGVCMAYSRSYNFGPFGVGREPGPLRLEKEIIPGASLSVGYKFKRAASR